MHQYLKFIFLLTPFFGLSMFLAMTAEWSSASRKKLAIKVGVSGLVISLVLLYFGGYLFRAFGLTVDSFRIGGGLLLLLSGIGLVNSKPSDKLSPKGNAATDEDESIAVVPLAMPTVVGPATIAAILITAAEQNTLRERLVVTAALAAAFLTLTVMFYAADWLKRVLGHLGLAILSKITGLILAAMASEMIVVGVKHILKL